MVCIFNYCFPDIYVILDWEWGTTKIMCGYTKATQNMQ